MADPPGCVAGRAGGVVGRRQGVEGGVDGLAGGGAGPEDEPVDPVEHRLVVDGRRGDDPGDAVEGDEAHPHLGREVG